MHSRRGVARDDLQPGLAQPASDVSTARRHVERGSRSRRPLDEQVEVCPLPMRVGVDVRLGPLAPDVARHAASSTARCAASSIVGETWRFGGAASARMRRALLGVRPVQADDDRQLERHLAERLEDPARHLVAARDPTEDVEEDRLHLRVVRDDRERVDDTLRVAAAAEVAEVRRPAARERDDVDGRHRETRAVPEHADLAVELDVGHVLLAGERLERVAASRSRISATSGCR